MASSPRSDDFDPPERSLSGRLAETIERVCVVGAKLSMPLFLPVGGSFAACLVGGYVLISLGIWTPTYTFLSLTEDIYFAWLGFLSGGVIRLGTGSQRNLSSCLAHRLWLWRCRLRMTYATALAPLC